MCFFWFFNIEQQQRKQGLGGLEEIEQFEINGLIKHSTESKEA